MKLSLPPTVAHHHLKVVLFIDFFFVNRIIFFHTKSYKINFVMAKYCTSRSLKTIKTIKARLSIIQSKHKVKYSEIEDYHGDNEFNKESIKDFFQPVLLHIYGREETVPLIKRSIRTIKETYRSTCNNVPY